MKIIKLTYLLILFTLYAYLNSPMKTDQINLKSYFVNPDLESTNYRLFEGNKTDDPKVIFKQIIKDNENSIDIEYYFMTPDSISFYGGMETIKKDNVEIKEQYFYLDNRKIKANKIEGNIWKPFSKTQNTITSHFLDKQTGYGFKAIGQLYVRFKDTLNYDACIVTIRSKTLVYKDGVKFDEKYAKGFRIYAKDKGLVYYYDVTDGNKDEYYLVENN